MRTINTTTCDTCGTECEGPEWGTVECPACRRERRKAERDDARAIHAERIVRFEIAQEG